MNLSQENRSEKGSAAIAPASMSEREVKKIAAEFLRPTNQGLLTIGSATGFRDYVNSVYIPNEFPLLSKSTRDRYRGVIANYLIPAFGSMCLRDMTGLALQRYLSGLSTSKLSHESRDKIRDVLSSILGSAKKYELLVRNPVEGLKLPKATSGKRSKPYVTPQQFNELVERVPEPYSTMVLVAVWTGLRVSELIGLQWKNVHADSITVERRICRDDVGAPKSHASNATIGVNRMVIDRIESLKGLTVSVKAGHATRRYKVVKTSGPDDLVFQSVKDGKPMRDNNVLSRFVKPAARTIRLGYVNWLALPENVSCNLAEHGRCWAEGGAGIDASFADQHDNGHLYAICERVAARGGRKTRDACGWPLN
jgi:integrase